MQQKGLYYELVTAQSEKEPDSDPEDENKAEESMTNKTRRQSRRMSNVLRRSSLISEKSVASDGLSESGNDIETTATTEKLSRMPILFQALKLNSPEWFYLLLGTIASLIFGGIMPVCKYFLARHLRAD
jgi:hypothetical protein